MGVKSVWFKGSLKGRGVVNYDGKDARWALQKYIGRMEKALSFDNVKVAKHSIRKIGEEDGKPKYEVRLKISSACIRHAIFEADQPFHNPLIVHAPKPLIRLISSVVGLLRGYMFEVKGVSNIKRKSPVLFTDAEQSNDTVSTFDIGSQLAPKVEKESADDASGLTLHYKECICEVVYDFEGAIDLNLLQFISMSQMYDRLAFNPDYLEDYRVGLKNTLGSEAPTRGWYIYKTASNGLPEEGLLLTQEQVVVLVREFFTRLLRLCIIRGGGGYAKLENLRVKHISDPIIDLSSDESGYYPVKSVGDLQLKPENVEVFYQQISDQVATGFYTEIDKADEVQKAKVKDQKKEKSAASKAKKAEAVTE
jgi:hypothetical protein